MKWLLAAILIGSTAVSAPAQQMNPASMGLTKAMVSNSAGAKYRREYGSALRVYCESLAVKVPRNTPSEATWVEKETMDSMIGPGAARDRITRLEKSVEYSRFVVRSALEKCTEILGNISTAKTPKEEAALWSDLAWHLSSVEDFKRSARILGLVTSSVDPDVIEAFQAVHQTILSKILSPLLRE